MVSSLEELIEDRKELIETHKKNNFTAGIHALLTDLYPDSAHFIYELLQNAEDMFATVAKFELQNDGVSFQHNGTKRVFNLADIEAITSIGDNQGKKNDPTTIGKFGVGFKAVFAYTSTPEIHSGEYHFRIKEYFLPEIDGVPLVGTQDNDGTQWTKFWFPFNHQKKTAEKAYQETLSGLQLLNDSSILFLNHLQRIEYVLPDQSNGFVERVDEGGPHHITINYHKPWQETIKHSTWLRFVEPIDMIDDQGNDKQMTISIAFALKKEENQKETIVPIEDGGRTFIYFPAEKEYSGLRFHINALFASTVARDSVRDCDENNVLIQKIADLLKKSIGEIKELRLLSNSFFECLPNNNDNLKPFYQVVLEATRQAFAENEYLPAKEGGFVSSKDAVIGPKEISDVWKNQALSIVFYKNKRWISNAPQRNSRLYHFFNSLNIEELSYEQFAKAFTEANKDLLEKYIQEQDIVHLKQLFALLEEVLIQLKSGKRLFISNCIWGYEFLNFIKDLRIIPAMNKQFGKANRMYILPGNTSLIPASDILFVDPSFIENDIEIQCFLEDQLSIKEYGEKDVILNQLKQYSETTIQPDEVYFKNLLAFAKYQSSHDDINFEEYDIFITEYSEAIEYFRHWVDYDRREEERAKTDWFYQYRPVTDATSIGDSLYITKAKYTITGEKYGFSIGEKLVSIYRKYLLWDGYTDHYSNDEFQDFIRFAVKCGAINFLTIMKISAHEHPDKTLCQQPGNETSKCIDINYSIFELESMLAINSLEINLVIWNTLKSAGQNAARYAKAQYRTNAQHDVIERDSSLIYYLRKYAWIPNRDGILHTPGSLTISEIHPDFVYDPNNALFQALQFGCDADAKKKELEKLSIAAESLGKHVVDENEYKEFHEYQEKKKKTKVNKELFSPNELFEKQNRKQTYDNTDEDDFSSDGVVGNKIRRERSIISSFQDLENRPSPERRIFSQISDSNAGEKQMLYAWYNGKCQMCETQIRKYDGHYHFIARNIIHTKDLPDNIRNTSDICWNSLCLCPNCAARYEYCSKSLSGLFDQILQIEVIERDRERIVLTIELDGSKQEIHYVPKHFLALQTVVKLIHNKSNDSDLQ